MSVRYRGAMGRTKRLWTAIIVTMSLVPVTVSGVAIVASASTSVGCHAPRFTGLTVVKARAAAKSARCHVRFNGAPVSMPMVQTIRHQSVQPGHATRAVTLSVNPLCSGAAAAGPPPGGTDNQARTDGVDNGSLH